MSINVQCPACGKSYKVNDSLAGKKGNCKTCGGMFQIPGPVGVEPEVNPYLDVQAGTIAAKAPADPYEIADLPAPRRVKPTKDRSSRSQRLEDGELDPVYKWGFGTVVFGVLGLVFPFFGIQFKGLHLLPVEAQFAISGIALLIGTGLLAGAKPANTLQRVGKYLWLTFMGFGVIVCGLMLLLPDRNAVPELAKGVVPPSLQANQRPLPGGQPTADGADPERPPGVKPVLKGEPLFSLGRCHVTRKGNAGTYRVEFHIEYQVVAALPAEKQFFAVVESRRSKSNAVIPPGILTSGKIGWVAPIADGDTGPFRAFLARVEMNGPAGKQWVQVSDLVRDIPLTSP